MTPAGVVETADERILVQVTGGFHDAEDLRRVNFVVDGRIFRLSDIATVQARLFRPAAAACSATTAYRPSGWASPCAAAATCSPSGRNVERGDAHASPPHCPWAIEPHLVAAQPQVVRVAVNDFMAALWEAIAIVLGVSFLSLGLRAGAVVACSIPLVLAAVFVTMEVSDIDLQRVSLGALIIALGLLVDDAMITVEMMVTKLEEGHGQGACRDLRVHLDRLPDAHRHAGHRGRLRARRLRQERRRASTPSRCSRW